MVTHSAIEIEGKAASRLQNDHLHLSVIDETGHVAEFYSRRTGHENLWVSGYGISNDLGAWGIDMPWVGPIEGVPEVEQNASGTTLTFRAKEDGLEQTVTYRLGDDSTRVHVQIDVLNNSDDTLVTDLRPMYHINVASDAEVSGILSHGTRFNSMTVSHGKHAFFVGREAEWPGEGHWENHEVGEDIYEPFAVRSSTWLRPRWFAFVDQVEKEGIAVRFTGPPACVRAWIEGYPFSNANNVQHDLGFGSLEPGQCRTFEMEWLLFEGLQRVDHVGPQAVLEIDLIRALLLTEQQPITIHAVSTEAAAEISFPITVKSDVIELEDTLEWTFGGVMDRQSAKFQVGPYSDQDKLHAIWYYISKKHGDCGRPTPNINLQIDGVHVQRKFAPSPETQEIINRIEAFVEEVRTSPDAGSHNKEDLAALLSVQAAAETCRRNEIDPERMFELCDSARSIHQAWGEDHSLFGKEMVIEAAENPSVKAWMDSARSEVLGLTDDDFVLPKPGRRGFIKSFELCVHAAEAAMIYAAHGDEECGRAAVKALNAFAQTHDLYVVTGAGNILHMSATVPSLIVAYDLARDLLTLEEEQDLLAYFFWLDPFMEQYVNAKGDNDEIQESGCIAWISARFPYMPGAERRIMRAHAVLSRQLQVVDDDGGWPEAPNYNIQVAANFLTHAVLFERIGHSIANEPGNAAIRKMVDWMFPVLTPDARIPQLGDGVNRVPSPDMFLLAAQVYEDGRFLQMALEMPKTATIMRSIPIAWLCYPVNVTPVPLEERSSEVLPHTGYVILRSKDPAAHFFISDFGPFKPGHGHRDKLSFELYAFEENLVRDTGYGFGQSMDHNLIVVDGKSQERIRGHLRHFESREEADEVVMDAEIDPGVVHRRAVYYERSRFFVIHDRVVSDQSHDYSLRMHFDGVATCEDDRVIYRAPGGAGLLLVTSAPVRLEDTETVVYSDEDGLSSRPINRAVIDVRADSADFTSVLIPFKGEAPDLEVAMEMKEGGMSVEVRLGGEDYEVRLEGAR